MAEIKYYKGRDGLLSSIMNYMFKGPESGYNTPDNKGCEWKTTDGTVVNIVGIGANNNYSNARAANPYAFLDTPVCCNCSYDYEDNTATSVGLTVSASSDTSSTTSIGYTTINMKISNDTSNPISFNCVKFLKTCAVSYNTLYKGNKTTLVFAYFLDSPYTISAGDSVDIVLKIKSY